MFSGTMTRNMHSDVQIKISRMKFCLCVKAAWANSPDYQVLDQSSLLKKFEKVYVDEINPYEIQTLLGKLQKERKSEATLRTYRGILRKFFNWLIENRMVQMPNPITKNTLVRKSQAW